MSRQSRREPRGRSVIAIMKKNKKFQKDQMITEGYTQIRRVMRILEGIVTYDMKMLHI